MPRGSRDLFLGDHPPEGEAVAELARPWREGAVRPTPPAAPGREPLKLPAGVAAALFLALALFFGYWFRPLPGKVWNLAVLPFDVRGGGEDGGEEGRVLTLLLCQKLAAVHSSPRLGLIEAEAGSIDGTVRQVVRLDFTLRGELDLGGPGEARAELYDHNQTAMAPLAATLSGEGHSDAEPAGKKPGELLELAQKLATELLAELGERGLKLPAGTAEALARIPTASPAALELDQRAATRLATGDPTALPIARNELEEALGLDPDFAAAHAHLARVEELGGHPEAARAGYERAVSLLGGHAPFRFQLGRFYLRGDPRPGKVTLPLAATQLAAAVRIDPAFVEAFVELGAARLGLGEVNGARHALEKARLLAPEDPTVLAAFGRLALAGGEVEEAVEVFTAARRQLPETEVYRRAEPTFWLAVAREELGERVEACRELAMARELDPTGITPLPEDLVPRIEELEVRCGETP